MSQPEAPSNNKKDVLAGDFRWGVRAYPAEETTTMITPLRKLYQHHADDCLRVAELADDPRRRELYLKLASEWIEAAETLGVDAAD